MNKEATISNESSLRDYFKYVLINEGVSVQLTPARIQKIIENDLEIELESSDLLQINVCIKVFPYYIQCWPKWNTTVNINDFDKLYNDFKTYLRIKFNEVKQKADAYKKRNDFLYLRDTKLKKVYGAKTGNAKLNISVPENMLCSKFFFEQLQNSDDLLLKFDQVTQTFINFPTAVLINHPFIEQEFNIPGYIHFKRSLSYNQQGFIMDLNMRANIKHKDPPFIFGIDKSIYQNKAQVFTFKLLKLLFTELNEFLASSSTISKNEKLEILNTTNTFLSDVLETDLCDKTVCEGVAVLYNIGKSTYFVDSVINCEDLSCTTADLNLVHRKLLTPIVKYNLISCSVLRHHIDVNGVNYFEFKKGGSKSPINYLTNFFNRCLKYRCILCNLYGTLDFLKRHMGEKHYLDGIVQCTKCLSNYVVSDLLKNRWKHVCVY